MMTTRDHFPDPVTRLGLCALLVVGASAGVLPAQDLVGGPDSAIKLEIEYAEALNKMGLPDYAKMVLDRIEDPAAGPLVKVIRMRALVAKGEWDAVKMLIAKEPDQNREDVWAMKLALGDGYYAWGKYPEAQAIYDSLFEKYPSGPPPALARFYIDSAYKYAQMLILMGRLEDAVVAFRNVTKAEMPKHIRRQVLTEKAELIVKLAEKADEKKQKEYFSEIEKVCDEILWIQDLWFGKAIVIIAHVEMIKGDIDAAMDLVDEYWKQLKQLDAILKEQEGKTGESFSRLSPMAECRYLLGVMMQDRAEKLIAAGGKQEMIIKLLAGAKRGRGKKRSTGALHHFLNVFIRYPGTGWAADAGKRANRVEEILTKPPFNAKIEKEVTPEQMREVERYQFQNARALLNQNQFKEAAENYIKALNLFPEGESSVAALGELARCYIETDNELYTEVTIRHLAERFCMHPKYSNKAGDQLLRTAMLYTERKWPEHRDAAYELYFGRFKKHPSAPATLFRLAEKRFAKDDFKGALEYYRTIKDDYEGLPLWFDALSRMATCYSKLEQPAAEIKTLQAYIGAVEKSERPGHKLISARYREAAAYRNLGPKYVVSAYKRFLKLGQLLGGSERAKYESSHEEKEKNNDILQGVLYSKAACYAVMKPPRGKKESYRKLQAIQTLEGLVDQFPDSKFAPGALSQIGTLWTILEQTERAGAALKKLQERYPDTPEAKNALFMLGMNLLEMERKRQAINVFRKMFASSGKYSSQQILRAGTELMKAGENSIALSAFNNVLAASQERALREPALLGKGKILIDDGKFEEGAAALERIFADYPRSGTTIEACMYLSRAYSELGTTQADTNTRIEAFNKAINALKRSRKFEQARVGIARLDLELARVAHRKAVAEDKFGDKKRAKKYLDDAIGIYQKLILFGNRQEPGVKEHIETAYAECMPLLMATERWKDVIEDCDSYIEEFRGGKYIRDIRSWRGKAKVKQAATGELPVSAPKEPEEE